jgi:DNA-binding Lrp family transcriptional regulator
MEVKKVNQGKNNEKFYLTVFSLIKEGLNPSKISKRLNISKQRLSYYIRFLKANNYIQKIGYGTWKAIKEVKISTLSGESAYKEIRSHGYRFRLELRHINKWDRRESYLQDKGIYYSKLKGLGNKLRVIIDGYTCWLNNSSIIVIFPKNKSYLSISAEEGNNYAILDFMRIIKRLESLLNVEFTIKGKYQFKPFLQHHALIKNELAKIYDKEGKKLFVYDEKGLWLLIDNSFNLHELELVSPISAIYDTDNVIHPFLNSLKKNPVTVDGLLNMIGLVTENQLVFAENQRSHIKAIQDLSKGVNELVEVVKELKKK